VSKRTDKIEREAVHRLLKWLDGQMDSYPAFEGVENVDETVSRIDVDVSHEDACYVPLRITVAVRRPSKAAS
jgi:hypothetical protein